ncbi:MAG TPA: ABC transporter substrate-binding protein [Dehalococcoidia bacterium]|nr:ABC transporter substrate-binding protein [Dehalococcoidia bacterium]
MAGYWERITSSRLSRRRAIATAAAAGTGVAALSMVGCGGGGDGGAKLGEQSGLIQRPQDETAKAKTGGTLKTVRTADVPTGFDVLSTNNAQTLSVATLAYPRLLKFKAAKYPEQPSGESEGDLADSFEISGDKLQLTLKLKRDLKWDARAPTNGRLIDAEDVLFSWRKFTSRNAAAQDLAYDAEKSAGAPIESISSPDRNTIIFKLKQPDSSLLQLLTSAAHFFVMPRESDGGFDPRAEVRGHGPWILDEYRPSAYFRWKKNPDYYVKNRPFYDAREEPILPEYAARLAQFKAGNIWTDVHGLLQTDIPQTIKDVPQGLVYQDDSFPTGVSSHIRFGYEGNSVFKDERMRQAVSLLIDREAFANVVHNKDGLAREGLDIPIAYHTIVGAGWAGYWIDPYNEKEFGPNHKYLKLDIAEAKKLMSAAGYANGVDVDLIYNADNNYGATYHLIKDVFAGNLRDGGIRSRENPIPYQTYYDNYYLGYVRAAYESGRVKGFNGLVYAAHKSYPTVASQLFGTFHKDGSLFQGLTDTGNNAHLGDPKVNAMIEQIQREFDIEKQQALVKDFIRYMTGKAYQVPRPVGAKNFGVYWPVIRNIGAYVTYPGGNAAVESTIHWWLDQTQPPVKAS